MSHLLINLAFLLDKPTGITTYATNVYPYFKSLQPTLLIAQSQPHFNCYPVSSDMSPASGTKGHLRRLLWTQVKLPTIYRNLKASLLFSPIPEAPLYQKIRCVVMVHDLIPLRFPKRYSPLTPYFRDYIPQVLRQSVHIVCNSQATADDIIDFWQIPAQKITPIWLGYDKSHFRPLEAKKLVQPLVPYFLYLGRCDPYKNLSRLIEAFSRLSGEVELWIAGPYDERYTPNLQKQVEELGIAHKVTFLSYVSHQDLPILLNQALALVFPTLWEGFGLPVVEAMACGTPIITSNLASLPEITGNSALLINPYDIASIRDAMQQVWQDEQLRSHLRQNSLQRASQFSWQITAEKTQKVLEAYL